MNAIIARSTPHGWNNLVTEYRLRKLCASEKNDLALLYFMPMNAKAARVTYVIERRYSRENWTTGNGERTTGNWEVVDFGGSLLYAALSIVGETVYSEATSLHPIHKIVTRLVQEQNRLNARKREITTELHHSKPRFESQFIAELKKAKLYKAALAGKADQRRIDAIKAPITAAAHAFCLPLYNELETIVDQLATLEQTFVNARM
jgi:hypothetical protein